MSEEISLSQIVNFRYKGVVDFDTLWKTIMGWYESKGFEVQEDKAKRNMSPTGEVLEVQFTGWRNVTEYYRYKIIVFQKYFDGTPVEVIKDGKKKKMMKARFMFQVRGVFVLDYADRFETSPFMKSIRKFMNNYVLKWQIDAFYGDQLMYKVYELGDVIKKQLNMETTGSEFADMW